MSALYPGLRHAAEICSSLARECDAKVEAIPHSPASGRRRAEARALRRAASRITDVMLAEPIEVSA